MTISKKLLIIVGFVGFMVSNVSAYNAVDCKSEIALMKNFAQELKKTTGDVEVKVAKWLEKVTNVKNVNYLTDQDVIAIAYVLDTKMNNHEKVTTILNMMFEKQTSKLKATKKHLKSVIKNSWDKESVVDNLSIGFVGLSVAGLCFLNTFVTTA